MTAAVAVLGLSLSGASAVIAQTSPAIEWLMRIEKADPILEAYRTHRLYVGAEEIELAMSLFNRSDDSIWFVEPLVRQAFQIRMASLDETGVSADVPVVLEWRGLLMSHTAPPVPTLPDQWLSVEPQSGRAWSMAVRRADGRAFPSGRYRIEWELVDLQAAVRIQSGEAWTGRVPSGGPAGPVTLIVHPPSTPREEARMHLLDARAASRQERWAEAITFYREAARVDPEAGWERATVPALLILGRYEEAVRILTSLPSLSAVERDRLSHAYVGVGDEARAAAVLRQAGRPEAEIADQLQQWRELVRRQRNVN